MNLTLYLTPTNLATEKAKFFADSQYHPQFTYNWETAVAQQWLQANPEYHDLAAAMTAQDPVAIQTAAETLFNTKLEPALLTQAQQILNNPPQKLAHQTIDQVSTAFAVAFQQLGLTEYTLQVIDQHGFNFRPVSADKKILASRHMNLDFFSIDGELKHELVHIIRYENGQTNHIPHAANYLPTEEGLAAYCQDYLGEDGQASLFQHAAEYAMTELSLQTSLRAVTEYLQDLGFSAELAFQRAVRHKFGFKDTSLPGDNMKPSMYFYHQQLVKQLSTDERIRLFVGKIGQDQLSAFPEYQGRIALADLQSFYQFN